MQSRPPAAGRFLEVRLGKRLAVNGWQGHPIERQWAHSWGRVMAPASIAHFLRLFSPAWPTHTRNHLRWWSRLPGSLALPWLACLVAGGFPPAVAQDFRVEPYLQNPASDSFTIRWLSETADPGTVTVGGQLYTSTPVVATTLGYQPDESAVDRHAGVPWLHSLRVTGLAANSAHAYSVTQGSSTKTGVIQTPVAMGSTQTSPGRGVRLFVYGDSETEPESATKRTDWNASLASGSSRPAWIPTRNTVVNGAPVAVDQYLATERVGYQQNLAIMQARAEQAMASGRATLAAVVGDLVESGGEQRDWDEFWRHNAGPLATGGFGNAFAASTPIVPALGNHENYGGPGSLGGYSAASATAAAEKYRTYFEVPDNGATATDHTGRYHRVDFGPITLITIDSSNTGTDGTADDTNFFLSSAANPQIPDALPGSAQYQWLEQQLAAARDSGQITFVQFHHAAYSSGVHGRPAGSDPMLEATQSGRPMRALTPLLSQYGVKAVFSGHDEMYEHSIVDGVHFYDVGIGGDGLRGADFGADGYTRDFLAHSDAAEVWAGDVLLSGGKHYGHLEIDVVSGPSGGWDVSITPAYAFPVLSATTAGEIIGWERRTYDDAVTFSVVPEPGLLAAALTTAALLGVRHGLRGRCRDGSSTRGRPKGASRGA